MTPWSAWFPDVLLHAPGVPDPTAEHAIARSAREFLRRTRAWVEWLDPFSATEARAQEADFDLPTRSEVVRIERATRNGDSIEVRSYRELEADWTRHGDAQEVVSRDLRILTLTGAWAAGEQVQVQVSLMPAINATGLPDEIAQRHFEAIAEGAKARLLATPAASFYNKAEAARATAAFESAVNKTAVDAWRGHTNNMPRATVRWF